MKYYLKENRVKWTFILEKFPWWGGGGGGFYERLIKLVKDSLKKEAGNAHLDYDQSLK